MEMQGKCLPATPRVVVSLVSTFLHVRVHTVVRACTHLCKYTCVCLCEKWDGQSARERVCVCICVCVRTRARVCARVRVCESTCVSA